ncbi:phosphate ABC transporter permease [Ferroacidibacillus organovorans]|uniref:Phosphate transport system permease protein PstA n=1 Tax=Ferroacidibacillus organovorans TaxID=1765683 RepID=A0A101XTJ8_9BACL|nr:phosphate ABC transporter permease [Ferroacidibacillus organovorans]
MRGYSRKFASRMAWTLSIVALLFVVMVVLDILISVVRQGAGGISLSLFTTQTSGITGGLQNAILGTLDLIFFSTLFAGPVGILGGIYLAVFASDRVARVFRFVAEVLAGIPSIVIGYFGYTMMVQTFGWGFSVLAGSISLSILTLPYIVRMTEASIRQVPKSYYEGALALGLTPFSALRTVVMRPATPGIVTGLLLAVSIGLGETAPLIYTAGWSNFNPTLHLTKNPIGYLTYVVWTYLNEPYASAHQLAYTAALLLIFLVVILHILARLLQPKVKG